MKQALYGGYQVTAEHNGNIYRIKVAEGVRGMDIPVSAQVIDGVWHISHSGRPLTVVEVTMLVPEHSVASFSIKPSDVVKPLLDTVWQNTEKEVVASNICKLSRFKNGDDWKPFTWEDYVSFCSHLATLSERAILDGFAEVGYLEKDAVGTYRFTRKILGVYMQYS